MNPASYSALYGLGSLETMDALTMLLTVSITPVYPEVVGDESGWEIPDDGAVRFPWDRP